jgi:hypothetical protein
MFNLPTSLLEELQHFLQIVVPSAKVLKKQIQKINIDVKIKNFDKCKLEEIMLRTTKREMKVHVKI